MADQRSHAGVLVKKSREKRYEEQKRSGRRGCFGVGTGDGRAATANLNRGVQYHQRGRATCKTSQLM